MWTVVFWPNSEIYPGSLIRLIHNVDRLCSRAPPLNHNSNSAAGMYVFSVLGEHRCQQNLQPHCVGRCSWYYIMKNAREIATTGRTNILDLTWSHGDRRNEIVTNGRRYTFTIHIYHITRIPHLLRTLLDSRKYPKPYPQHLTPYYSHHWARLQRHFFNSFVRSTRHEYSA